MSFRSVSARQRTTAKELVRVDSNKVAAGVFTFRDIATATQNFNPEYLLGEGGFGRVYKGKLKDNDQMIAIKQFDINGLQGSKEFVVEVLVLRLLCHQNLVKMLGYCADGHQRILVYEFMPLGSLENRLLDLSPDSKPLDWFTRMKIAAGAAKGLEYLHETAKPPVIYKDFRASNILLDADYTPKLSDFGLSKLVGDQFQVSTRVMGSCGYSAPEYEQTGELTKLSDAYSFGVVLLEIITGRKAIDTTKPTDEQHLVHWAEAMFRDKTKFVAMADPLLEGKYPMKGLYQAIGICAMCLQPEASNRPLMGDVVAILEHLADTRSADAEDALSRGVSGVGSDDGKLASK